MLKDIKSDEDEILLLKKIYGLLFEIFHENIEHYYRNLYNIIKFIDNEVIISNNFDTYKKYIEFLHTKMSTSELVITFYITLSYPKLKILLEKYNFLIDLPIEELFCEEHRKLYNATFRTNKEIYDLN